MIQVLKDQNGKTTLEQTGVTFWINLEEITELSQVPPMNDEIDYYAELHDAMYMASSSSIAVSRRVIVTDQRCISFLQLLRGRKNNVLMVACRSIDTRRLPSDLGFLSREAKAFGCDRIVMSIGSLHTVLT